jgi:hypothetical protein
VLIALTTLLVFAGSSGLIKEGAAAGNLGSMLRQQLQQAGVLQALAVVMAAVAADLRSAAAAMTGLSGEEQANFAYDMQSGYSVASSNVSNKALLFINTLYSQLGELWVPQGEEAGSEANSSVWLCDPSGHAEAATQLCTSALQHTSSVLQHIIPGMQERAPHAAAALMHVQQEKVGILMSIGGRMVVSVLSTTPREVRTTMQQGQRIDVLALNLQYSSCCRHWCCLPTTCHFAHQCWC